RLFRRNRKLQNGVGIVIASSLTSTHGNGAIGFRRAWMSRRLNVNGAEFAKPRKVKNPRAASIGCAACTDRTPQSADRSPSACIDRTQQQLATQRLLFPNGGRRCVTSLDRAVQTRRWRPKRFRSPLTVSFPKLPRQIQAWLRKRSSSPFFFRSLSARRARGA